MRSCACIEVPSTRLDAAALMAPIALMVHCHPVLLPMLVHHSALAASHVSPYLAFGLHAQSYARTRFSIVAETGLDAARGRRGDGDDNVQGGEYILLHARRAFAG